MRSLYKLPFFILLSSAGHQVSTVCVKIAGSLGQEFTVEILFLSKSGFL